MEEKVEEKQTETNILATGRRKTSVARIQLKPGRGEIIINKKPFRDYFPRELYRFWILKPLKEVNALRKFDIKAKVKGGGPTGQAGAVAHGIARALVLFNETWRPILRGKGLLTRDSRMVERKKYGHKKARKAFQYSKR
jgi:small subunit ribosomal protein S9